MKEVSVMGGRQLQPLRSPSLGGTEPTPCHPHACQPCANSPTGVSSLISRYVSKKWLIKKGSRFTWPGRVRGQECHSSRRHRVGAAEGTEPASRAAATFPGPQQPLSCLQVKGD